MQAWGRSIAPNWRFWLTAPRTFPTIDRFLNGVATSVKSFDLAAKTYQNADRLGGAIARFANQLAGFTCGRVGDIRVGDGQISNRGLEIVVQASKLTEAQAKAIADAAQKAPRVGATIEVIGVK